MPDSGREAPILLQSHSGAWPPRQTLHCVHCEGEMFKGSSPRAQSSYESTLKTGMVLLELVKYKFISKLKRFLVDFYHYAFLH